jgi:hypothetical protein
MDKEGGEKAMTLGGLMKMEDEVKTYVNLEKEMATIQIIRRIPLFDNPAKRFLIESDVGGFSCIEKRQDGYYLVNFLRERDLLGRWLEGTEAPIHEKPLTPEEAKRIIREVLKDTSE